MYPRIVARKEARVYVKKQQLIWQESMQEKEQGTNQESMLEK